MYKFLKKHLLIISLLALGCAFADTSHLVQKGETLYSIGRKYQLTISELRTANNLSENDVIKAGQRLVIPTADLENAVTLSSNQSQSKVAAKTENYTVKKGDTLYGIARKYDIKVAELYAMNGLKTGDVIKAGQKIKVPSSSQPAAVDITEIDPKKYTTKATDPGLKWPVSNPTVTYVKGKVSGVQLSSGAKENVVNIRSGTVMYTGTYRGFGEVVFVQSMTGLVYAYTGLSSIKVKKGTYVVSGDVLGKSGVDSHTKKNGIMLMVIQNGEYIDPAKAPRG
ncbi:MAG: M23 family metallopeptidase [Treponema sp.]|uniref:M23 family metallopeptidase n=1 Tax=Treponema sp. TaxID=166 RepID=UPI001B6E838A|nr:M23 family metallopeptidase [Treponema sp.]MBP5403008.1 M23 family metallopeptidase [Treponema sp.]MBR5934227.1 M23 family metallopeptidase [Treponema sp.]